MPDLTFHIAPYIDAATDYLIREFGFFFDTIAFILVHIQGPILSGLTFFPLWVDVGVAVVTGLVLGGWRLAAISFASLGYIAVSGLWGLAMQTLASVLTAALVCIVVGIPLGILIAEIKVARAIVSPFLDLMQTMPAFVMLVPAVYFFGVGLVGGIVATIIFAMPLPIRLTAHGLSMVDSETVEAATSFGSSRSQLLWFVKLPLAFRSVMAGINQCIMLALSVTITASFIGAGGLGDEIIRSISRLQIGRGIESGLAIVGLAIFLDRLTGQIGLLVDPTIEGDSQYNPTRWLRWFRGAQIAPTTRAVREYLEHRGVADDQTAPS